MSIFKIQDWSKLNKFIKNRHFFTEWHLSTPPSCLRRARRMYGKLAVALGWFLKGGSFPFRVKNPPPPHEKFFHFFSLKSAQLEKEKKKKKGTYLTLYGSRQTEVGINIYISRCSIPQGRLLWTLRRRLDTCCAGFHHGCQWRVKAKYECFVGFN